MIESEMKQKRTRREDAAGKRSQAIGGCLLNDPPLDRDIIGGACIAIRFH